MGSENDSGPLEDLEQEQERERKQAREQEWGRELEREQEWERELEQKQKLELEQAREQEWGRELEREQEWERELEQELGMSRIYVMSGPPGSGKSTCAGSGELQEGQRHFYAETDPGSFKRANFANPQVFDVHHYFPPLETLLEFGRVNVSKDGGIAPHNTRKIAGMSELMEQFASDLLTALRDDEIADFVYDTSSGLWQHVTSGFQQEIQDAVHADEAKRLNTLYYTEPNRRMRSYVQAPAMMGKGLSLVEHEKEIYISNQPTGTFGPDGFKEVSGMADACVRFFLVNKKPKGRIMKAGAGGLSLVDLEIDEPTIPRLNALLDAAETIRSLQQQGLDEPMPGDYESIVRRAKELSR